MGCGFKMVPRPICESEDVSVNQKNYEEKESNEIIPEIDTLKDVTEKVPPALELTPLIMSSDDHPKIAESKEYQYEYRPPDGGWGWMVLLGTVIVNALIPGLLKSFGVLFVEFLSAFNASSVAVSWIPALTFCLYNLLGPVASAMSLRFSCRVTTCIGGLIASFGLALSYFANSIEYLYFSYGILGGIGAGLSYTPGVLIIGRYFETRRGFANGVCASGSALGSIILPPFLNYLLSEYGHRGAVLLMCGVILNVCVGAALYQPVELHWKRVCVPNSNLNLKDDEEKNVECSVYNQKPLAPVASSVHMYSSASCAKMTESNGNISCHQMDYSAGRSSPLSIKIVRAYVPPRFTWGSHSSVGSHMYIDGENNLNMGVASNGCENKLSSNEAVLLHRSPSIISTHSTSSFAYLSTIHHGSATAAIQMSQVAATPRAPSVAETAERKNADTIMENGKPKSIKKLNKQKKQPLIDTSLLYNTMFLILSFSVVASGLGYSNLLIVLPVFASDLGLLKTQYSLLLSIIAGTDFVGRLLGAWMSDMSCIPRKYLYISGYVVSGTVLALMPYHASSFEELASCCALFGFASGIYIGLMAVMLIDYLGAEKLASSFGLSLAINGIIMLAGPPTIGMAQKEFGSYKPVITMLGVIICSGGLVWFFEPFASKYEERKHSNNQELTNASKPARV